MPRVPRGAVGPQLTCGRGSCVSRSCPSRCGVGWGLPLNFSSGADVHPASVEAWVACAESLQVGLGVQRDSGPIAHLHTQMLNVDLPLEPVLYFEPRDLSSSTLCWSVAPSPATVELITSRCAGGRQLQLASQAIARCGSRTTHHDKELIIAMFPTAR